MPLKVQHDDTPTPNLTSMIDVVFLLIIFFMVATRFSELERNIDVAVPEVSQAGDTLPPPRPLVVAVLADGHMELDGQPVTPAELTAQLAAARARQGDPSVVIRGDAQCTFQDVAAALAACREANISELGITVRIAGTTNGGSRR
jgi:biopolymer transport protein ExbD